MKIDLHSHTTASDGHLSPSDLMLRAVTQNVQVLALTDHDSMAGLDEAQQAIDTQALPLILIPGVEISCSWESLEIHIVGLDISRQSPEMSALLEQQQERRLTRAQEISVRLAKHKVPDAFIHAQQLAGNASLTRAHFARFLVEQGYCKTMDQAFKRYLSRGAQAYVPHDWVSIERAIAVIHAAGGQAVLAHPTRYKLSTKWLKRLLVSFKEAGGDAIEVSMCQQSPHERATLGQYCRDYGLMASVGSDFHLPFPWLELGKNLWLPKDVTPVWQCFPTIPDEAEEKAQ